MDASTAQRKARILVVEDLDHSRELFRTLLEREGYAVETAADGRQAIEAARAGRFDLILLDIQMPVMNGLDAARAIRGIESGGHEVTIIGMSANTAPDQLLAFEEAGIDDHLGKPFRRAHLMDKIAPWLAEAPAPAGSPCDGGGLKDLVDLLGPEWARTGLDRLGEQIEEAFPDACDPDPLVLARQAHAIVSQAALLGFRTLSERASALEDACLSGRGVPEALAAAREAAERARGEIERLRPTLP